MASLSVDDIVHKKLKSFCEKTGIQIKTATNEAISNWLKEKER